MLTHVGEGEFSDEWKDSEDEIERQVDTEVERDVDDSAEPEDEADTEVAELGRRQHRIIYTFICLCTNLRQGV